MIDMQTLAPGVEYFNNAINDKDAKFIIDICEKADKDFKHPWKFDAGKIDLNEEDLSFCKRQNMLIHKRFITDEKTLNVYDIVYNAVHKTGLQYSLKYKFNFNDIEGFSFIKYDVGDQHKAHYDDGLIKPFSERQTAVIIYLNPTDYTGGETYLNYFDLAIKPKQTGILFFPANYTYLHESLKLISGNKYVIVAFLKKLEIK